MSIGAVIKCLQLLFRGQPSPKVACFLCFNLSSYTLCYKNLKKIKCNKKRRHFLHLFSKLMNASLLWCSISSQHTHTHKCQEASTVTRGGNNTDVDDSWSSISVQWTKKLNPPWVLDPSTKRLNVGATHDRLSFGQRYNGMQNSIL